MTAAQKEVLHLRLTTENEVNLLNKVHDAVQKIHIYTPAQSHSAITKCKDVWVTLFRLGKIRRCGQGSQANQRPPSIFLISSEIPEVQV
jgi:hypothetical protein